MKEITFLLILLVGIEHLYIMILEVFLLKTDLGQKTFNITKEVSSDKYIRILFLNQGFYNLIIGIGVIISLFFLEGSSQLLMLYFFLSSIIFLSFVGAISSSKSILIKQGFPAFLALLFLIFIGI